LAGQIASEPTASNHARTWRSWLTRLNVLGILIGLPIGLGLGAWFRFLESKPPTSFLPSTMAPMVVTVLILGAIVTSGLLLSAVRRTRSVSRVAFAGAAALLAGFPLGHVIGPEWQPATSSSGMVELELAGSTSGVHSGRATCRTEENSRVIASISADIGDVDGLPVAIELLLFPDAGVVILVLDGASDRSAPLGGIETETDRTTGRASFQDLVADELDPDPEGEWTGTAGAVRWTCA
jgi:hypothetical protein